ncbi:MAG: RDD family protein [Chitinophagales bacterium]|nr:RDD family protein [Chitinophagales bacterium]
MEEYQSAPQEEQHLFDNFEQTTMTQAGSGKRLANYIIDLVTFYVFMYFFSYVIVEVSLDLAIIMYNDRENGGNPILGQLITLVFYGLYMGLMETLFRGRTLGKLITGTIAVNEDGSRISGGTALLRGLSRAVPFNALSALGTPCYPWHDKWNKTYVVEYADFSANK